VIDKRNLFKVKEWIYSNLNIFKDDEARFRIITGLKIAIIPYIAAMFLFAFLWVLLRLDLIFFEAHGYMGLIQLRTAFYDYIFSTLIDYIPYFIIFTIALFVAGGYLANLLLRPFRLIGEYSEKKALDRKDAIYNQDFFSDLKLLSTFSEFFFYVIDNAKMDKKLSPVLIPIKYTKMHKPVFERAFFINYSLLLLLVSICAAISLYVVTVDIHEHIIQLSIRTLSQGKNIGTFLNEQSVVLDGILVGVMSVFELMYIVLAFHLYSKVSSPAFAFFATMRAFLKGNYNSRVHLLGNYHIRNQSRKFNMYLNYLVKNLVEVKKKPDTIK
jgi:hypothetical protein